MPLTLVTGTCNWLKGLNQSLFQVLRELYYQRNEKPGLKNRWLKTTLEPRICSTKPHCEDSATSKGAILFQVHFQCCQWGMTGKEEPQERKAGNLGEQWAWGIILGRRTRRARNWPRQRSHRACPARLNSHLGQVMVGSIYFLYKWESVCSYQVLILPWSIGCDGKNRRENSFFRF